MTVSFQQYRGRRMGTMKKLMLASMATAIITLPMMNTQASAQEAAGPDNVQSGRTIEAFLGSDLANVQGYPANTEVKMEVVRNGVLVGSKTANTDGDGFLEINHVGGADCWDEPATPDIMGGDVIRTTTTGDPDGTVDYATARDVGLEFETIATDPAAGTITVQGHAKSLENAPIAPGDGLELRLNKGSTDLWDSSNRKDLREDVGANVQPDGSFTHVLNVGTQDANDWQNSPGEVFLEWAGGAGAGGAEAAPPAIFVADEGEGGVPGCPATAEDAMTQSSSQFINTETVQQELTLSGISFGATGVKVSIPGGAQQDATLTPVDAAAPNGHQTWTAKIPASELAALPQGEFQASASFEGPGVKTTPSTLSLVKDTEAPANPAATPDAGSHNSSQAVTLSGEDGAAIHYTVNGSDPTATSRTFGQQIQITASQTIKAISIDKAGNASGIATFDYVIRQDTALDLNSGRSILTFGQRTALSGTLTSAGDPLANKPVLLQQKAAGEGSYSEVPGQPEGGVVTGDDGSFSLAGVKPDKNTVYRAKFATEAELKPSASIARISVRARVTNATSTKNLSLGQRRLISGAVLPDHTGTVRVIIKRGNNVVVNRNVALSDTSRYRFSYKPGALGRYSVRVIHSKDADHLGNTSPAKSFRVTR